MLQVYNNYAIFNGGGLYVDTLNYIEFYNSVFVGNGARFHGGGVATGDPPPVIDHIYYLPSLLTTASKTKRMTVALFRLCRPREHFVVL